MAKACFQHFPLWCLVALALGLTPNVPAQQKLADAKWEVLEGCRLMTNSIADGDSFHVRHLDREYVFRLYFVDTPEGDASLTERAKDQAAYFGIFPNDIPRAAKAASKFTRETLSGLDITIITRWQNALGRSRLARFYAVVLVNGKNLAEELVARGHARIYGLRANWPDGPRSTTFINKLKNLELTAREQKRGVWDGTKFPLDTGTSTAAASGQSTNGPAVLELVEINSASYEELQTLPGIRAKLAERIMAHRPYQKFDDLDNVPGIGPATLKRLKPLIRIESVPP
jgi:DNA uptake protein ComE-like DNA-binding protein